ncbi:MAG: tRNA (adenosine(37)-N6)-threonylcarbamoyltransferase complex transferase subunit TsaD [Fimbriimonas sp.]
MTFFEGRILAIESSCDETSAAVVDGRTIRSNIIATQIELHAKWGGVVPEAAARAHLENILPVIEEALQVAGVSLADLAAVAVTNRPGLVGALSVGVSAAKTLAFLQRIPLIGIHHLEGHLSSVLSLPGEVPLPMISLIASGGHTELVLVRAWGDYEILAETRDDAAGEAFDKGARLLGLGMPGGAAIQRAAVDGNPKRYRLPVALSADSYTFSFSGLKTAMLRLTETEGSGLSVADAAASLQEAVVRSLAERSVRVAMDTNAASFALVGGVAANLALRTRLADSLRREAIPFFTPAPELCTDNAAMIGLAASWRLARGDRSNWDLEVSPGSELPVA